VRPSGRFGELTLNEGVITSFREKPDTEAGYINGGFFVINKKIGDYLTDDKTIFEFDALPKVAAAGKLHAYRHDNFWQCMDNPREMEMLNKMWADGKAPWKVW
jgi:glucose-1-phosphate cytidylyltransferase